MTFDCPLLTFSPCGDYLAYVKGHQLVVHCTEMWDLKSSFNCPISPQRPRFVNPYTIFLYNHDGVIEWFTIFGTKIKSDSVLPSRCIVNTELSKDSRTLFGSTYDNKILSFDTISMERKAELEYVYSIEPGAKVRNFVATNDVQRSENVRLQKFEETDQIPVRELKNVMDQFKRKTETQHFTVLNYDDSLLATYNPDHLNTVWVWDFFKKDRLESIISLSETAGKIKALRWHPFTNRLAICCSNLVVIWTKWDDLLGFQGDNMNFKWLNIKAAIGVLIFEGDCRFVYFK
uniref:WD repeat-containing protein WRAP73 n=1 Tax=Lygus hesperus TaxID=30085 RepID=A0A0A9WMY8_LYGHE